MPLVQPVQPTAAGTLPPQVQQHVFVAQPAPVAVRPTFVQQQAPITSPVSPPLPTARSAAELLAETELQLQQIVGAVTPKSPPPSVDSPPANPLTLSGGASKRPVRPRDNHLQGPAVPGNLQQAAAAFGTLRSRVQTLHLDQNGNPTESSSNSSSGELEVEVEVESAPGDAERVTLEPVAPSGGIPVGSTVEASFAATAGAVSPNSSRPTSPGPSAAPGHQSMTFSLATHSSRSTINLPSFSQTAPSTPVIGPGQSPFGGAAAPNLAANPLPERTLSRSMPPGASTSGLQRAPSGTLPPLVSGGKLPNPVPRALSQAPAKDKKDRPTPVWMTLEDPILDDVIRDPDFMACFLDYLRTIHAEEILSCWIEIEVYKTAAATDRVGKGKEIVDKYFDPRSRCHISLENVNHSQLVNAAAQKPDRDLFDRYQPQLWELLALQCYPKFRDSEYFKKLMQDNLFHKKHKELLKSKEFRTPGRSGIALHTLDEYLAQSSRPVSIVPNVSEREFQLEDLLYSAELLCAFRDFLQIQSDTISAGSSSSTANVGSQAAAMFVNSSGNLGNVLLFWLDAELFKFCPDRELKERADRLFAEYIANSSSASFIKVDQIDVAELQREIADRPNKNSFLAPQMRCWDILQHFFGLFQLSDMFSKFFEGTLPVRQSSHALRLFEHLQTLRNSIAEKNTFSINLAKVTNKLKAKRQQMEGVVDLETCLTERDWFVCFKDFLSKRQALENLHFWMDAELYRFCPAVERRTAAQTIWTKFFSDTSPFAIHIDVSDRQRLLDAMNRTPAGQDLSADLFRAAQEHCWQMLNFDMMPKFQVSDHYKKTLAKLQKSKPSRQLRIRAITKDAVLQMQRWLKEDYK